MNTEEMIDVWKVTVYGASCFVDKEEDALELAGCDHREGVTITKEMMSRAQFESLPDFDGF